MTLNPRQFEGYRSGGIGHLPGDESRSVVGMVPVRALEKYREHDGNQNPHIPGRDRSIIDGIRNDIRSGVGIHTPLMMEYDHHNSWGSIGEGSHRLAAAREEGLTHVPVRVYGRSRDLPERARNRQGPGGTGGAPLRLSTDFGDGYVPPDIHPHHFDSLR